MYTYLGKWIMVNNSKRECPFLPAHPSGFNSSPSYQFTEPHGVPTLGFCWVLARGCFGMVCTGYWLCPGLASRDHVSPPGAVACPGGPRPLSTALWVPRDSTGSKLCPHGGPQGSAVPISLRSVEVPPCLLEPVGNECTCHSSATPQPGPSLPFQSAQYLFAKISELLQKSTEKKKITILLVKTELEDHYTSIYCWPSTEPDLFEFLIKINFLATQGQMPVSSCAEQLVGAMYSARAVLLPVRKTHAQE